MVGRGSSAVFTSRTVREGRSKKKRVVLARLELLSGGGLVGISRDERRAKNSLRT
jgi:hypothetical protein